METGAAALAGNLGGKRVIMAGGELRPQGLTSGAASVEGRRGAT